MELRPKGHPRRALRQKGFMVVYFIAGKNNSARFRELRLGLEALAGNTTTVVLLLSLLLLVLLLVLLLLSLLLSLLLLVVVCYYYYY